MKKKRQKLLSIACPIRICEAESSGRVVEWSSGRVVEWSSGHSDCFRPQFMKIIIHIQRKKLILDVF